MLVTQVYLQPQFHSSLAEFHSNVPALSEAYRTPLFESSQRDFYTLFVTTFEAHPAQEQIPWPLTAAVLEVAFPLPNSRAVMSHPLFHPPTRSTFDFCRKEFQEPSVPLLLQNARGFTNKSIP
jgi:hypothetical protein